MSEINISREEAIKKEIKVAEESQKVVDTHIVFTDDNGDGVSVEEIYADDTEIIDAHLLHYQFCADYHKFIADQLEKLEKIEQIMRDDYCYYSDNCIGMCEFFDQDNCISVRRIEQIEQIVKG